MTDVSSVPFFLKEWLKKSSLMKKMPRFEKSVSLITVFYEGHHPLLITRVIKSLALVASVGGKRV